MADAQGSRFLDDPIGLTAIRTDDLLLAYRDDLFRGSLTLQSFEAWPAEALKIGGSFGGSEEDTGAGLDVREVDSPTHLADTREHVDGRAKVADVKDWQGKLDIAIVTNTFRGFFATGVTICRLVVWTLDISSSQVESHHSGIERAVLGGCPASIFVIRVKIV